MSGSEESYTPLRYNISHRNYYLVTSGQVNIKLIPPSNGKYLQRKLIMIFLNLVHPLIHGMYKKITNQNLIK